MTKLDEAAREQREADMERLERVGIVPGARVYTVLRGVSRSGMQRTMTVHVVHDGAIVGVTSAVARLLGNRVNEHGAMMVRGVGMDMGFAVVYALGRVLHDDGYAMRQEWA